MTHPDILEAERFGLPEDGPEPTAFCAGCGEEVPESELRWFPHRIEAGRVKEGKICKPCRDFIRKDDPGFARMRHDDPYNILTEKIRELEQ